MAVDHCKEEAGKLIPVVNFNSCEGKGPYLDICLYNVFEMQVISQEQFGELSFFGKIKTRVHGKEKACVINAYMCHSCGLCVVVCPEKAIRLQKVK